MLALSAPDIREWGQYHCNGGRDQWEAVGEARSEIAILPHLAFVHPLEHVPPFF